MKYIAILSLLILFSITRIGFAEETYPPGVDDPDAGFQIPEQIELDYTKEAPAEYVDEHRPDDILSFDGEFYPDVIDDLPIGPSIGYDGGFFFVNEDNTFSLVVNGRAQIRWSYDDADGQSDRRRFEIRRFSTYFSGHIVDETIIYVLGLEAGSDGEPLVDEAYVVKTFNDTWWIQAGQFSLPFLYEDLTSSAQQLGAERSLLSKFFGKAVSPGIQAGWEEDHARAQISYSNGFFKTASDLSTTSEAVIGRAEWKPLGDWNQFRRFSSPHDNELGLLVSAAVAYQHDQGDTDVEEVAWSSDIIVQGPGWNTSVTGIYSHDYNNGSIDSWGFIGRGGIFVTKSNLVEVFSQYQWGSTDIADQDDLSILSFGTNVFLNLTHLKWTTDWGYSFNGITDAWANDGAGWRTDEPGRDGQWLLRTQLIAQF